VCIALALRLRLSGWPQGFTRLLSHLAHRVDSHPAQPLLSRCGFAAMVLRLPEKIRERAENIRLLHSYIGFFEFMVWAHIRERMATIIFGNNLVWLGELFGTPLAQVALENPCHVVAVVMTAKGELLAAQGDLPNINHFVIAVPIAGATAQKSTSRMAVVAARKAGFAVKLTDATGDCGIDCMTFFDGSARTAASFSNLREELADFMVNHAEDKAWQTVFASCQEAGPAFRAAVSGKVPTGSKGGMGPSSSPSASSSSASSVATSSASSSSDGLPVSGASNSASQPAPVSASEASIPAHQPVAVSALVASSPAPEPPAVSAVVASSQSVLLPPLPPPGEDPPPAALQSSNESFAEWLRARPKDDLAKMVVDYKTFKSAEAKWLALHPRRRVVIKTTPAKKHTKTSVQFRHATALAYTAWKAGPGSTSTCPLKVPVTVTIHFREPVHSHSNEPAGHLK
jgi:hypothetical protein